MLPRRDGQRPTDTDQHGLGTEQPQASSVPKFVFDQCWDR
jgi:hypothetical protein